jgi:Predicted nucleic-acid-binding protein, contains PIN domain
MKTRTVDTNILVRLLVRDDSEQWEQALRLAMNYCLIVLPTVALETEWVLRTRFKFNRDEICSFFRPMMASETFDFAERKRILRAIDCFEKGMDFADAMHLCFVDEGETFVTFDRDPAGSRNDISIPPASSWHREAIT